MALKKAQEKKLDVAEIYKNVEMDVWSVINTLSRQNKERENYRDKESVRNIHESTEKEVKVVRTCNEKRRRAAMWVK